MSDVPFLALRQYGSRVGRAMVSVMLWLAGCLALPAAAQVPSGPSGYPARAVDIIIPFPAGGAQDVLARLLAERLTRQMDVPVSVINRPGANGMLASDIVAKAPSDGHVLLLQQASMVFQSGHEPAPSDIFKDFTPVGRAALTPLFLVVDARVPARTAGEWFALLSSNPKPYNYGYGVAGSLSWMYAEYASRYAQVDVLHVAAKGEGAVVQEMLAGRISACFCTLPSIQAQLRTGKLRVLAVTGETRSSLLPTVPTFHEAGFAGYATEQWLALFAPGKTPKAIIQRLSGELRRALSSPDMRDRLAVTGLVPYIDTSEAFAATLRDDVSRWQRGARLTGTTSAVE